MIPEEAQYYLDQFENLLKLESDHEIVRETHKIFNDKIFKIKSPEVKGAIISSKIFETLVLRTAWILESKEETQKALGDCHPTDHGCGDRDCKHQ